MTGRYQAYLEYKDTKLGWLGSIPKHWEVRYSKWLFKERNIKATKGDEMLTASQKYGVIPQKEFMKLEQQKVVQVQTGHEILKSVKKNDFVISMRSFQGGIEFCGYDGSVSSAYVPLIPSSEINLGYFRYLFKSKSYIQALQSTTNLVRDGQALRYNNFIQVRLPLPDKNEQSRIADFLDHETVRIERLIYEQEKFVELLEEKRKAVVSHAVTKGLDPDITMKESGLEWLGQIPKHWDLKPLRYLGVCQNGINIGASFFGSGFPFFSYGDVYKNDKLPLKGSGLVRSSMSDRDNYSVKEGDVFFTRTSETIDDIGLASTSFINVEDATFAGFLIRFRPTPHKLLKEFSRFYFRNPLIQSFFVGEMNLVTRASLSQDLLKKLMVAVPPIEEQQEIANFLEERTCKIDKTIENATRAIDLLHQKRDSLISAAVTGKIDVRNWNNGKELSA